MEINGDGLKGVSGVCVADFLKEMRSFRCHAYDFRRRDTAVKISDQEIEQCIAEKKIL